MRVSILAVLALVALAAVSVTAQSSTGGAAPTLNSPCERITSYLKYANPVDPASQYSAISTFIVRVATGKDTKTPAAALFNNPVTKAYFDGTIKYRNSSVVTPSPLANQLPGMVTPDFTNAAFSVSLTALVDHLVRFFGAPLGCQVSSVAGAPYPTYSTTYGTFGTFNQYQIHGNMQIGGAVFAAFNNQVVSIAGEMGAIKADADAVMGVLSTFARTNVANANSNEICTQADCPCASNVTGDNCDNSNSVAYTSASFVTMAAAALVALFAMRR